VSLLLKFSEVFDKWRYIDFIEDARNNGAVMLFSSQRKM